ncbi:hypothetical protein GJ744_004399 [Endocarpon pusillum]|uniref:Ankyrin repeat-containing protein n=1 Tax=Endocarpon pusillum TaxID=364733 RepID=A0A8H7E890_9EURO|nr:hypothetical protein GJ744_004399 [Endocarpon pusillum]
MVSPPPTAVGHPASADQLPPEALALATRLFDAARNGQIDILEQALRGGLKPNMTNGKGDSLIMLASYHGHVPLVHLLIRHGADPNTLNDRGQSPLAGAVFKNEEEIIKALLEGGADPTIGEPSALEATKIFRQERFEGMFKEQIEKLGDSGGMTPMGTVRVMVFESVRMREY